MNAIDVSQGSNRKLGEASAIDIDARLLTWAVITFELGLTLSLFIPFVEWPPFFKRIRIVHLTIGTLMGLAAQAYNPGFNLAETFVVFSLWMTFLIYFVIDVLFGVVLPA